MFEIDESTWTRNDLGVLDKVILTECIRRKTTDINEEVAGHILLFTRCKYDNVVGSINKLIDLNLLSGEKVYEEPKPVKKELVKQEVIATTTELADSLDSFIRDLKETLSDSYKECTSKYSVVVADDALKLVIYCFKNCSKKLSMFRTISQDNLLAIYDAAIQLKIKEKLNELKVNQFATISGFINKCIQ